jgi:hypothetical protein
MPCRGFLCDLAVLLTRHRRPVDVADKELADPDLAHPANLLLAWHTLVYVLFYGRFALNLLSELNRRTRK